MNTALKAFTGSVFTGIQKSWFQPLLM